jgi:hypothetical protein
MSQQRTQPVQNSAHITRNAKDFANGRLSKIIPAAIASRSKPLLGVNLIFLVLSSAAQK